MLTWEGLSISNNEVSATRIVDQEHYEKASVRSIAIQATIILSMIFFLIIINLFIEERHTWYFSDTGGWFYVDIYDTNYWVIYDALTTDDCYGYVCFAEFVKNYYDITINYHSSHFNLYLTGVSLLILGLSYWLICLLFRTNAFEIKKALPGYLGGAILIAGSTFIFISCLLNIRVHMKLNAVARAMGIHVWTGGLIYVLSIIIYSIILILSVLSIILPKLLQPFRKKEDILKEWQNEPLVRFPLFCSISLGVIFFIAIFLLAIGLPFSRSSKYFYISMFIIYATSSVIMGIVCGLNSKNLEKNMINTYRGMVIFGLSLSIISAFGSGSGDKLWWIALPWVGVVGSSLTAFLVSFLTYKLRIIALNRKININASTE
ncbi:MAG: hypothetical protein FK734_08100 [Asgard group archaeon]|nr:hypothetical protein [Asgard group archaeon]